MVSPRFAMCHISKLTNPFLPLPPLQKANPHFQHAIFPSSPTCSSSSPPSQQLLPIFQPATLPSSLTPPSPSLPQEGPFFATCHISKLANPLLPLPPLQQVSSCLPCAAFPSSRTCSSLPSSE